MKAIYNPETEMLRIGGGKSVYVTREEFEELREKVRPATDEKVEISKKELEFLLDLAYAYDGGAMETHEVEIFRRTAELLELNPITYTAYDFKKKYKHAAELKEYTDHLGGGKSVQRYLCKWCFEEENHESHKLEV